MDAGLLRTLTLPDRFDVVVGDVVVGRAGLVSVNRLPRLVRIGLWTGNLATIAAACWWFLDGPSGVVVGASLLTALAHAAWERRKKVVLTDPVLAQAAVRAARALGREVQPGRWRIDAPGAQELGREFVRLHAMASPRGPGNPDLLREQAILDAAAPALRPFMQPTLAAGRPLAALEGPDAEPPGEGVPHLPGAPWPVLDQPHPEWPVLPAEERST